MNLVLADIWFNCWSCENIFLLTYRGNNEKTSESKYYFVDIIICHLISEKSLRVCKQTIMGNVPELCPRTERRKSYQKQRNKKFPIILYNRLRKYSKCAWKQLRCRLMSYFSKTQRHIAINLSHILTDFLRKLLLRALKTNLMHVQVPTRCKTMEPNLTHSLN